MLTLAYGWNLGKMEGGRRVNAGWSKPARLAKNSAPRQQQVSLLFNGLLAGSNKPEVVPLAYGILLGNKGLRRNDYFGTDYEG